MRTTSLAVVAVLGSLLGCSSTEHNSTTTTAGGGGVGTSGAAGSAGGGSAGATGGGSAGASGSVANGGAGLVLGDTQAEACIAYALAVCRRRAECSNSGSANGTTSYCLATAAASCPDLVFSPGATRTVAGLKACAAAYETWPCEDLVAERRPSCVTPGTRARGETCAFASQCSGLDCQFDATSCGKCGVEGHPGDDCTSPDVQCVDGYCSNGVCVAEQTHTLDAGKPCTAEQGCLFSLQCKAGTCTPFPQVGESCEGASACTNSYCGPDKLCQALPGVGQPCGRLAAPPGETGVAYHCAPGALCLHDDASTTEGNCVAAPQAGQPCLPESPQGLGGAVCDAKLYCDGTRTCQKPGPAGADCSSTFECEPSLVCDCPGSMPDCATRHCVKQKLANERCDEPNTACHSAFKCEAGVCKPTELRGIFAQACTP